MITPKYYCSCLASAMYYTHIHTAHTHLTSHPPSLYMPSPPSTHPVLWAVLVAYHHCQSIHQIGCASSVFGAGSCARRCHSPADTPCIPAWWIPAWWWSTPAQPHRTATHGRQCPDRGAWLVCGVPSCVSLALLLARAAQLFPCTCGWCHCSLLVALLVRGALLADNCHVTPCFVTSHHVMSRHSMSCHVML